MSWKNILLIILLFAASYFLIWTFIAIKRSYSWQRKEEWLRGNGFKRDFDYLHCDVSNNPLNMLPCYVWKNSETGVRIPEDDIEAYSLEEMIKEIKRRNKETQE